jgi:hypothetical protein
MMGDHTSVGGWIGCLVVPRARRSSDARNDDDDDDGRVDAATVARYLIVVECAARGASS